MKKNRQSKKTQRDAKEGRSPLFPWETRLFPEWPEAALHQSRIQEHWVECLPHKIQNYEADLKTRGVDAEVQVFFQEVCFFRLGRWQSLAKSLSENALHKAPPSAQLERELLKILSNQRVSPQDPLAKSREQILKQAEVAKADWIPLVLRIEESGELVRSGHYRDAIQLLHFLRSGLLSVSAYWAWRLHSTLSLCFQALGRYQESRSELKTLQRVIGHAQSPSFQAALYRRNVSLSFESEDYEATRLLLPTALSFARQYGLLLEEALLLQEQLRLSLVDGLEFRLKEDLQELQTCVANAGLTPAFMSLVEERCEIALRQKDPVQVKKLIEKLLAESTLRKELAGECIGHLYLARAHWAMNERLEAQDTLERSLRIAKEQGYGKSRVRILLYACALAHSLGRPVQARLHLEDASSLSKQMGLSVQIKCAQVILGLLRGNRDLTEIIGALKSLATFHELFYYLRFYGFLDDWQVRLSISDSPGIEETPLESFLEKLPHSVGLFWFQTECILVCIDRNRRPMLLNLAEEKFLNLALALALNTSSKGHGFSAEQIHELAYPKVKFRSLDHGSRVRSLISRLRQQLSAMRLDLVFVREKNAYELNPQLPLVTVVSFLSESPTDAKHPLHQFQRAGNRTPKASAAVNASAESDHARFHQILSYLKQHGSNSTSELCRVLQMTRQSLHPWLRQLVETKKIVKSGFGRATHYTLTLEKTPETLSSLPEPPNRDS